MLRPARSVKKPATCFALLPKPVRYGSNDASSAKTITGIAWTSPGRLPPIRARTMRSDSISRATARRSSTPAFPITVKPGVSTDCQTCPSCGSARADPAASPAARMAAATRAAVGRRTSGIRLAGQQSVHRDEARSLLVADGVLRIGPGEQPHAGVLSLGVHRVELDVEARRPVRLQQPLLDRPRDDPAERLREGILRVGAAPHLVDDEKRRQPVEVRLAASRRPARADGAVDPVPGAQDRRVPDASGDLERQAGRRGGAADLAGGAS